MPRRIIRIGDRQISEVIEPDLPKGKAAIQLEFSRIVVSNRESRGIKQKELADLIGIPKPRMWAIENGVHSPTLETIRRIARALEIDISELMRDLK